MGTGFGTGRESGPWMAHGSIHMELNCHAESNRKEKLWLTQNFVLMHSLGLITYSYDRSILRRSFPNKKHIAFLKGL